MARAFAFFSTALLLALCLGGGLLPAEAAAQSTAFEFGVGGAPGVAGGSASALGAVARPLGGRFGARLGLAWTRGRVLGTAEATVALQDGVSVFKPRLLVGGGVAAGGGEARAVATGGLGLVGRISPAFDGFAEGRGVWGAGGDPRSPAALITVGVRFLPGRRGR